MRKFVGVLLAAVMLASACGGDSDEDATESTTDTAGASQDDASTTDPGDASEGDGTADGVGALTEGDCNFVLAGAWTNPVAALTPGAESDLDDAAEQMDAIADAAPEEIRDEFMVIAERYDEFVSILDGLDLTNPQAFADPEVQDALGNAEEIFDEEYEAAAEAVSTHFEDNC